MDTALMHSTSWGYAWNHLHGYCPNAFICRNHLHGYCPNAFNVVGVCLDIQCRRMGYGGSHTPSRGVWGGGPPRPSGTPHTGGPQNGPKMAQIRTCPELSQISVPKKVSRELSRLGELLNTQKNVHFFVPGGPRGVPGGSPGGVILGGILDPPKNPHFHIYSF